MITYLKSILIPLHKGPNIASILLPKFHKYAEQPNLSFLRQLNLSFLHQHI